MWSQRKSSPHVRAHWAVSSKTDIIISKPSHDFFCLPLLIHEVSRGGVTGSITTSHVTLKRRCAGAQGRWTSMPGTIQNSMRRSISASPPMSMDPHTPTRSDYDSTVRSVMRESTVCLYPPATYRWQEMDSDLSFSSVFQHWFFSHFLQCVV